MLKCFDEITLIVLKDNLLESHRKVKTIEAEAQFSTITLSRQKCLGWWQGRALMCFSKAHKVKSTMADSFRVA